MQAWGGGVVVRPFGDSYNILARIVFPGDGSLTAKPKILVVRDTAADSSSLPVIPDGYEIEEVRSPLRALSRMTREPYAGVFVAAGHIGEAIRMGKLLQNERILEEMPDGIVLLDAENTIIWGNGRLREWTGHEAVIGENFYSVLNSPEILGPDFCPFHTALTTGKASSSTLRSGDNRYFHVHAAPVSEGNKAPEHLIVTVHDVTKEVLQQQKLAAIHQAGQELSDLTAEELSRMSIDERIELLKSNILHYTKDLLHFDVVEIRLLDQKTNRLEPLLAVGMEAAAEQRVSASPAAKQRRDRLRRRDGKKLFVRRHDRRSAVSCKGVKARKAR